MRRYILHSLVYDLLANIGETVRSLYRKSTSEFSSERTVKIDLPKLWTNGVSGISWGLERCLTLVQKFKTAECRHSLRSS